jgi:hypothetical protein
MRKITTALILAASVAAASSIYAQTNQEPSGSMMDHGMMGDKNTMNEGGMIGMMNMMQQMSRMMDHCGQMMSGNPRDGGRPNDQWRKESPATPGPSR